MGVQDGDENKAKSLHFFSAPKIGYENNPCGVQKSRIRASTEHFDRRALTEGRV